MGHPERYATLWATKEAIVKALGCGFDDVDWSHVSVELNPDDLNGAGVRASRRRAGPGAYEYRLVKTLGYCPDILVEISVRLGRTSRPGTRLRTGRCSAGNPAEHLVLGDLFVLTGQDYFSQDSHWLIFRGTVSDAVENLGAVALVLWLDNISQQGITGDEVLISACFEIEDTAVIRRGVPTSRALASSYTAMERNISHKLALSAARRLRSARRPSNGAGREASRYERLGRYTDWAWPAATHAGEVSVSRCSGLAGGAAALLRTGAGRSGSEPRPATKEFRRKGNIYAE